MRIPDLRPHAEPIDPSNQLYCPVEREQAIKAVTRFQRPSISRRLGIRGMPVRSHDPYRILNRRYLAVVWRFDPSAPDKDADFETIDNIPSTDPPPRSYDDLAQIISHCADSIGVAVEEIPPFYWRPKSFIFPAIGSVLFVAGTIYVIQATISWKHGSIAGGSQNRGWQLLEPILRPLVNRGARAKCLYLVDQREKGEELCVNDPGDEYPLGYCDLSSKLRTTLQIFRVSIFFCT